MMVLLLAACSPSPRFLEPPESGPDPFWSPNLANCTYTQDDNGEMAITWVYDGMGRLQRDVLDITNSSCETTYHWEGLCLQRMRRGSVDGYAGWCPREEYIFGCDEHDNWIDWKRRDPAYGDVPRGVYRFDHRYDGQDQLVETQVWAEGEGEGQSDTQLGLVTWLWYDERRPLEVKYLTPGDGGVNTQTWLWDHDRLLGWDIRGSGAERAMTRTWENDQLTTEVQTEEEVETLTFTYNYQDKQSRFPRDVDVVGVDWAKPFGPPRPTTVLELAGGLFANSNITVSCKEGS